MLLDHPALVPLSGVPGVWVVGGAVRDHLLGRPWEELDLAVEGDAVALARDLGEVVRVHERFGTATVRVGETLLDLASTRSETYPRPGALPEVRLGASLGEDLRRRDFSVNAMAVEVATGRRAEWPSAGDDLARGLLRVLHVRSFLDDPTRLFRLARYARRLGFTPEPETAALRDAALEGGALQTLSESRIAAELRLLAREQALDAVNGWGLGLHTDRSELRRALALLPPDGDPEVLALAAAQPRDELPAQLAAAGAARSRIAAALRRVPVEAAALAGARGHEQAVRWWLQEGRHVRLDITGDDLVAAGLRGPAVGAALERALAAKLDGRASGRDAELAAALDR